eukprot:TRINITY_DN202_c0_g1_i1.p1 TRINITY_DN202_c0_g1~~TRINITY_DN202_c0_g1_i1.p1  ORF type:complete len:454 (-),score=83.51 TRINITY_DN202_c0_g1_i1:596-1957(-)
MTTAQVDVVKPWRGNYNDPTIKKVNFLAGSAMYDDEGYFTKIEKELQEKENKLKIIKRPDTTVRISVLSAEDLTFTKLPDSYVLLSLNSAAIVKSKVVKREIDPTYDFNHVYSLDLAIFNEVELSIWDDSDNSCLGITYLDLGQFEAQNLLNGEVVWLELKPKTWKERGLTHGKVKVALERTGKSIPALPPSDRLRITEGYDFELSESEMLSLLNTEQQATYVKLQANLKVGIKMFDELIALVTEFDYDEFNTVRNDTIASAAAPSSFGFLKSFKGARRNTIFKKKKADQPTTTDQKATPTSPTSSSSSSSNNPSLEDLPEEVLIRIFSHLHVFQRKAVFRVSKQWQRILSEPSFTTCFVDCMDSLHRAKLEQDNTKRDSYYSDFVKNMAVVVFKLDELFAWKTKLAKDLMPFPIMNFASDPKLQYKCVGLVLITHEITKFMTKMDLWKVQLL